MKQFAFMASLIALIAVVGIGVFTIHQTNLMQTNINSLQTDFQSLAENEASSTQKITTTQQQLSKQLASVNTAVAPQKTQDQLLITAVAKTAPAVVSIVISKYVPDLQVNYMNPFGNDPLFKDFGFQIPVYQQKGTSLQNVGAGSGFIISHDGYIVTNKHVVDDTQAEYTALLSTGAQKPAKVIYRDPKADVAILKIDGTYGTVATFGDSTTVKLGQTVVAIGNALGQYSNSVSVGIISGLNRSIEAENGLGGDTETLSGVFQTDASINPGNSGGPLTDLSGNVIGINVATIMGGSNISFAIPSNVIRASLASYIK